MKSRTRKFVGMLALLVFLTVYALVAMTIAISLSIHTSSEWIELAYYAIAGLLWVIPAAMIIKWMSGGHDPVDADAS